MKYLKSALIRIEIQEFRHSSRDIFPWLNETSGTSLPEEVKCYSLPYGVLGVTSHILTYYTLVCLWKGRQPFLPWKQINNGRFGLLLSATGLIISVSLAAYTMDKCRNNWQLLVIAVWKLSMSLLSGLTSLHVAFIAWRSGEYEERRRLESEKAAWWIVLYIPGVIAGMTGITSLIYQNKSNQAVLRLTIGFWCIVSAGLVVFSLLAMDHCCKIRRKPETEEQVSESDSAKLKVKGVVQMGLGGLWVCGVLFIILAALYGDLVLGFLSHNLIGLPSGDNAGLFWSYFVAKRLSMLL
ncbi:hypothetical protein M422DRAFT_149965 [Sphaerobolus stellatus SS14]|nr:hypothetical protein M422DRAFT_149965 [Sphaerobolus stellatus SS14]